MFNPFELSKDGIESQFATNHLAHHFLTMLLLPIIKSTPNSRIVTISSMGHRLAFWGLGLETINDPEKYNKFNNYAVSKSANILFSTDLTEKLKAAGVNNVYVNTVHPGNVNTNLQRHTSYLKTLLGFMLATPEDGALTQLYLATSPEVETKNIKGQYYVPTAVPGKTYGISNSKEAAAELWEFSENLIKQKVPSYQGASI